MVSAQIPDPKLGEKERAAYECVSAFQLHRKCGDRGNPNASCLKTCRPPAHLIDDASTPEPNQGDHAYDEVIMDSVDDMEINEFLNDQVALETQDERMPTPRPDPAPADAPDAILDSQETIIDDGLMELIDANDEELAAVEVAHHQGEHDQFAEDEERQYVDNLMDAHIEAAAAIQQENPMLPPQPANIPGEK